MWIKPHSVLNVDKTTSYKCGGLDEHIDVIYFTIHSLFITAKNGRCVKKKDDATRLAKGKWAPGWPGA